MNPLIAIRHQRSALHDISALTDHDFDDLINLSIGDPDIHTPEPIIRAACEDALQGHTHYTNGRGQLELRQAVCASLAEQGIIADDAQCMITTSACHAMWLVLEAMLDDGDEVIVFSPYFFPYVEQIKLARGVAVDCPSDADDGFRIHPERLRASITAKTKAIILNTPNNPTGVCYSHADLQAIAEVVMAHDLIVIADDIYTAFCFDAPHVAMASLPGMATRTITLGSFSKNFCMTGWRIGYAIAPPELIRVMETVNQNVIFSPPSISQRAALHALALKDELQGALVAQIKQRAEVAVAGFNRLRGVRCLPAQGGMYVFPDIRATGMSDKAFADYVLAQAHIRVIPGSAFGAAGAGHIRVALTLDIDTLHEAFARLRALPALIAE